MRHWTALREELAGAIGPGPLALCFDFDGTLAPIVPHPEMVAVHPGVEAWLQHWARDPSARMAIVSGRALEDVRTRVRVPGLRYAGNHGLQLDDGKILVPPPPTYHDELELCRRHLTDRLRAFPGAWLEDKGLSLTVHVRATPPESWESVRREVADFVARHAALGIRPGHAVFEIRPRLGATKADAVAELLRQWTIPPERLWFFGDDETDEDVFRRFPTGMMIRVQPQPGSAARGFLNDPADLSDLLHWMSEQRGS